MGHLQKIKNSFSTLQTEYVLVDKKDKKIENKKNKKNKKGCSNKSYKSNKYFYCNKNKNKENMNNNNYSNSNYKSNSNSVKMVMMQRVDYRNLASYEKCIKKGVLKKLNQNQNLLFGIVLFNIDECRMD